MKIQPVNVWGLADSRGRLWRNIGGHPMLFLKKSDTDCWVSTLNPKRTAVALTITARPPRPKASKKKGGKR